MKKRTPADFSEHTHRVEIFKSEQNTIRVDHFQKGDKRIGYFKFTNTEDGLFVTGDYGRWSFCRPFVPSKDNGVSEGYWLEKLKIGSNMEFTKLDQDGNEKEIKRLIRYGLKEYGYSGEKLNQAKEFFKDLLTHIDNDIEYIYHAYYDSCPDIEMELIPCYKEVPAQLLWVFDAFDEICRRIKESENTSTDATDKN